MPYSHPQPIDREEVFRRNRHVFPGAVAFGVTAGYINAVGLVFFGSPVSHMSGAISNLGREVAEGGLTDATTTVEIVFSFVLGAALSGFVVGAHDFLPGRRYGVTLLAEAALLVAAMLLLAREPRLGLSLLAMACGTQNGMTSSYCGLVIRTTHVTGTVTDIGVMCGHWVRHRQVEAWKVRFMLAQVAAFATGIWLGAKANTHWGPSCLTLVAAGTGLAGVSVWMFARRGWLMVERKASSR